jgi:hypothetical protein
MDLAFRELSGAKSRMRSLMSNFDEFIFFFIKAKFSSIALAMVYNFNAEKGKNKE